MELERLCELLGFTPGLDTEKVNGEPMYTGHITYITPLFTTPETALIEVYEKLERMVTDIIRVNRKLSDKDLLQISIDKGYIGRDLPEDVKKAVIEQAVEFLIDDKEKKNESN